MPEGEYNYTPYGDEGSVMQPDQRSWLARVVDNVMRGNAGYLPSSRTPAPGQTVTVSGTPVSRTGQPLTTTPIARNEKLDQMKAWQEQGRAQQNRVYGNRMNQTGSYYEQEEPPYDYSWMFERGPDTGGSPGYDNRGAVAAFYANLRDEARGDMQGAKKSLTQVYDQMAAMIEPMAHETAKAYDSAIQAGATESEALIEATTERINNEAAVRAAAMADLGITGSSELSGAQKEAERGMSDIGANTANWGGLMNAFSLGQQARFNQDYIGAGDAKVMAVQELVNRYQDYLERLNQEEASAMEGAYKAGTPGKPGPMVFETLGSVGNDLLRSYFASEKVPGFEPAAPDPYMPSYARDLAWAKEDMGVTPDQIAFMQRAKAEGTLGMPQTTMDPRFNPGLVPYI